MDSVKEIKLCALRSVINTIFDHIEQDLNINMIDLQHDYYNDLTLNEVFEINDKSPDHVMGQLYDDWEFLEKLLNDREGSVSLMLDHVAPILRYIAYRVGQ